MHPRHLLPGTFAAVAYSAARAEQVTVMRAALPLAERGEPPLGFAVRE